MSNDEIILHCDMDAFYCQVETVRLNLDPMKPIAVQQWHSLIATNYPARAAGVKRSMLVSLAKTTCPDLICVHVPTYRMGEPSWSYRTNEGTANMRDRSKVSLAAYRQASRRVFQVLNESLSLVLSDSRLGVGDCSIDGWVVEKASIDEAYILLKRPSLIPASIDSSSILNGVSIASGGNETSINLNDTGNSCTDAVLAGVLIAKKLKLRILETLNYTISIGVSRTKSTSKILSAIYKPDKISLLLDCHTEPFMKTVSFQKIGSLGGKYGQEILNRLGLSEDGSVKCADLYSVPRDRFKQIGAEEVFDIIRGQYRTPVESKSQLKSMLSAKAFGRPVGFEAAVNWLQLLCCELWERMSEEYESEQRWPRTLLLQGQLDSGKVVVGKSQSTGRITNQEHLFKLFLRQFSEKKSSGWADIMRLSISCTNFTNDRDIGEFMQTLVTSTSSRSPSKLSKGIIKNEDGTEPENIKDDKVPIIDIENVPDDLPSLFRCLKCRDLVFCEDLHQHIDYHIALNLQKPAKIYPNNLETSSSSSSRKRQNTKDNEVIEISSDEDDVPVKPIEKRGKTRVKRLNDDKSQRSITSFFLPKPKSN